MNIKTFIRICSCFHIINIRSEKWKLSFLLGSPFLSPAKVNKRLNVKQQPSLTLSRYFPFPVVPLVAVLVPAFFRRLFAYIFGTAKIVATQLKTYVSATGFAESGMSGFHTLGDIKRLSYLQGAAFRPLI